MLGRTADSGWSVVLETPDASALAAFYARLLGWQVIHDSGDWAKVAAPQGPAYLSFQSSDPYVRPVWPPVAGEQLMMMHLDIEVPDLDAATTAAVAAGATVSQHQPQDDVRVLLDPDGHPFCLWVRP